MVERQRPKGLPVQAPCGLVILDRLRMDVRREHSEIPSLLSTTVWLIV